MDYWHKRYTCPYFTSSDSRVSFETGGAASRYMNQFCAGAWEHCTIARHLTAEYERQEEKNGE